MRTRAIASVLIVGSLIAAACGGDDEPDATDDTVTSAAPSVTVDDGADTSAAPTTSGGGAVSTTTTPAATTTDATSPATTAPADDAELDPDAELRFAYTSGVRSFDPHRAPNSLGDQVFMRPVYDHLLRVVRADHGGIELGPMLATSFEVADDGLSIELELRDDVTFQDGEAFDATVAKANLERAQDAESTVASVLSSVRSVEAVDPTHLVIHLTAPDPSIPWTLATNTPGIMVSPAALDNADLASVPVGSGPFRLASFQQDAEVVYERWDDYWNPDDGALVARLVYTTITDGNARYNGLQSGDFDVSYLSAPFDSESEVLTDDGYTWTKALSAVIIAMLLNNNEAPLDDARVRQAISMAVNREEISSTILNGLNPPIYQVFPEGFLGHDPALDVDPYDPEAARTLVQEAGAEGATIRVIQPTNEPYTTLSVVIQQALGEIGLEVELLPFSPGEARPTFTAGGYHGYVSPVSGRPEPSVTLRTGYLGGDTPSTPSPELVALADAALVLPLGSDEREAAYQEISAYLHQDVINVPIAQFSTVVVSAPNVVGGEHVILTGTSDLDFRGVGIAAS